VTDMKQKADPRVKSGQTIVVWFSCGAASAVAAKKALEIYGGMAKVRIINNPIAEEHADNRRFLLDVQAWLGVEIEEARNPKYPDASCVTVWDTRKYMAGPQGAPCTTELKKGARQHWERTNKTDWLVLGFTSDERRRSDRFRLTERDNLLPVLVDLGIDKNTCFDLLLQAGLRLPDVYLMGYPNANCIGCVKASSPTYWNHVRAQHPDVFEQRADQSRKLGARLVRFKGERMFLDELPSDARGAPMRSMSIDCGIFCEEREGE